MEFSATPVQEEFKAPQKQPNQPKRSKEERMKLLAKLSASEGTINMADCKDEDRSEVAVEEAQIDTNPVK